MTPWPTTKYTLIQSPGFTWSLLRKTPDPDPHKDFPVKEKLYVDGILVVKFPTFTYKPTPLVA